MERRGCAEARVFHPSANGPDNSRSSIPPVMATAAQPTGPPLLESRSSQKLVDGSKAGSSRNPISLRLVKVLGTNYDDPATREALITLSDNYRSPEAAKGKTIEREIKAEDDDVPSDSESISLGKHAGLSSGTAARARKSLRRDAELKLTQGSRQFVKAFQEVDKVRKPI